jgi:hypothetical protein
MLIGAVLAWRFGAYASGLAARTGVFKPFANIVVSTHALPGRVGIFGGASRAYESVKKLFGIGNIHLEAGAVIPVLTATLTIDHHAVVIWAAADAIFASIVAL